MLKGMRWGGTLGFGSTKARPTKYVTGNEHCDQVLTCKDYPPKFGQIIFFVVVEHSPTWIPTPHSGVEALLAVKCQLLKRFDRIVKPFGTIKGVKTFWPFEV